MPHSCSKQCPDLWPAVDDERRCISALLAVKPFFLGIGEVREGLLGPKDILNLGSYGWEERI